MFRPSHRANVLAIETLLVVLCVTSPALADPPAAQPMPTEAEMAAAMQMMMPGEHHKLLETFAGDWEMTSKVWMGGPGTEPAVSHATSHAEWVLGGRFVMSTMKGEMFGMPHEGIGMLGYDNFKNMYVGTWASNMGTEILSYSGMSAPGSNTIIMYGAMDEPNMRVVGRTVKYVYRIESRDKYTMDLIDLHAGDDYKVVEVSFTRRK
ncbi:MAG: DUF1579 family protein [bacterium]